MSKFIITSEKEVTKENLTAWLQLFQQAGGVQSRLIELDKYYNGLDDLKKASITKKKRIDNKIHVNLASMIVNNSVNYFIGKPVSYKYDNSFDSKTIEKLQDKYNEEVENKTLAKDCSRYGIAYELVNVKEGKNRKKELYYKRLDPLNTFCVVDDTILQETVCFVTYTNIKPLNKAEYQKGYVYTQYEIFEFAVNGGIVSITGKIQNSFNDFPVVIFKNNDEMFGDYEKVTELLSAYSRLYSCSFDDFESIANALLIFYNIRLSEDDQKQITETSVVGVESEDSQKDAKAEYIYKKLDVNSFKELRNMMREDIFAITNVADFTDENFGGNQSGVAISYKLIGFENLRLDKSVYFRDGLLQRWKLIGMYKVQGYDIKKGDITIEFFPNIPENVAQDLEYVKLYKEGVISLETLLSKLETVKDPKEEMKRLEDEEKKEIERTKEIIQNEEIPQPANTTRLRA